MIDAHRCVICTHSVGPFGLLVLGASRLKHSSLKQSENRDFRGSWHARQCARELASVSHCALAFLAFFFLSLRQFGDTDPLVSFALFNTLLSVFALLDAISPSFVPLWKRCIIPVNNARVTWASSLLRNLDRLASVEVFYVRITSRLRRRAAMKRVICILLSLLMIMLLVQHWRNRYFSLNTLVSLFTRANSAERAWVFFFNALLT